MFRAIVITVLLMFGCAANAGTDRFLIGGWSKHIPASNTVTNETHNIIGVELNSVGAGYFENSYGRDTYYVHKTWRWKISEHVNFVSALGVNYGYRGCFQADDASEPARICPHGYAGFEYVKYTVVPTLKIIPGAILFSPEIQF